MRESWPEFERRGTAVSVVTPASPINTRQFCHSRNIPFRCLADPGCEAYRAFGLERGSIAQVMGPEVMLKMMRFLFRGNFGLPAGDLLQLGGSFVIGKDGIIRLAHAAQDAADMMSMDKIFACL